jgi:trans-2-enoyl-CoA reductase
MEGVEVKEKDVCVKMMAAPINPSDINRIEGVYPVRPPLPAIGGYEGVGEVLSVGSAVKHLSPGDWVIQSPPSSGSYRPPPPIDICLHSSSFCCYFSFFSL